MDTKQHARSVIVEELSDTRRFDMTDAFKATCMREWKEHMSPIHLMEASVRGN